MPENDFEKQVQQSFEELRIKPSEEVWSKVYNRIQKDKYRKRTLFWIPAALLLLSAGGYWMKQITGNSQGSEIPVKSTAGIKNDTESSSSKTKYPATNPLTGNSISKTEKQDAAENETINTDHSVGGKPLIFSDLGSDATASNGQQHSVKPPVTNRALANTKQPTPAVQLPVPDQTGSKKELFINRDVNPDFAPAAAVTQSVLINTTSLPDVETEKKLHSIQQPLTIAEKAGNTTVKLFPKKRWEFGIVGTAGASQVSNGFWGFLGNNGAEKSIPGNLSTVSNDYLGFIGGQSNYLAALPPPASEIKAGFGWQAGAFAKKFVNPKLAITSGLNYHYASTNRSVGYVINNNTLPISNAGNISARYAGYYSGDNSINYTSRYHFLEVPVGVQWQINKNGQLPLQLNGGISLGYLVNTNAIHYHDKTGAYYEDKALFNKMQGSAYAGISTTVFERSKRPLYVGPVIQYNFTNLLKPSAGLQQNLMYAGLKAEWVLWKK